MSLGGSSKATTVLPLPGPAVIMTPGRGAASDVWHRARSTRAADVDRPPRGTGAALPGLAPVSGPFVYAGAGGGRSPWLHVLRPTQIVAMAELRVHVFLRRVVSSPPRTRSGGEDTAPAETKRLGLFEITIPLGFLITVLSRGLSTPPSARAGGVVALFTETKQRTAKIMISTGVALSASVVSPGVPAPQGSPR